MAPLSNRFFHLDIEVKGHTYSCPCQTLWINTFKALFGKFTFFMIYYVYACNLYIKQSYATCFSYKQTHTKPKAAEYHTTYLGYINSKSIIFFFFFKCLNSEQQNCSRLKEQTRQTLTKLFKTSS